MDPMKIVYLHQYFSTPSGAGGIRSYEMAKRLVARGHSVLIVCGSAERSQTGLSMPFEGGSRRGMVDGIEVLEFDLGYSNSYGFVRRTIAFLIFAARCSRLALVENYGLIVATSTPLTIGIPAVFARWLRGKHFVFEVRDLWPELPRAMGVIRNPLVLTAMSCLEWVTYQSAGRLIGLSPGIVDGIVRRGVDRSAVTMIPNGCDIGIFESRANSWRPDGVAPSDLMAIFAGAHGPANGLDAVLDAAAELKRRNREDIKLVLIGDGKLKPHLQRRAAQEELSNVVFHAPVNKARLAGLMANADIGMQVLANVPAFYFGTSPNKFFDYLASGLPILINYPGWLAQMVADRSCGYAVPAADTRAFADALVDAADNRDALPPMGERSLSLAREQFDRQMLADRFVDWIEGCIIE